MKILLVYPFLPHPKCAHGSGVRIFNYLRHMSKRHQITLCCFVNEEEHEMVRSIEPYCSQIRPVEFRPKPKIERLFNLFLSSKPRLVNNHLSSQCLNELNTAIAQNHYDIIHFEMWMGAYIDYIKKQDKTATVLFEDNIHFITTLQRVQKNNFDVKTLIYCLDYLKMKNYEPRNWKKFDKIITIAETEKHLIEKFSPNLDISIVPNGVDASFYKPNSRDAMKEKTLVFIGNFWHHPNEDAVIFFLKTCYKRIERQIKDIKFLVVGKNPTNRMKRLAFSYPGVEIKGYVDDIRPYLSKALIFVAPIRLGGGMRGKILEAMAMGVPVVSTSRGIEGIDAVCDLHVLLADTPNSFSDAIIRLMKDKELQKGMSSEARRLIENKYDWKIVYEGLEGIYTSLVERKNLK